MLFCERRIASATDESMFGILRHVISIQCFQKLKLEHEMLCFLQLVMEYFVNDK